MSGESVWTSVWPVFGLLAAEAALLVGIAALIERRLTPAAWRRTTWQGCIVALVGLLALEFSGSARYLAAFVSRPGHADAPPASAFHESKRRTPARRLDESHQIHAERELGAPSAPLVLARNEGEAAEAS